MLQHTKQIFTSRPGNVIRTPRGIEIAVGIFCAYYAWPIVDAWRFSPFDKYAWIVFAIWLIPYICSWFTISNNADAHIPNTYCLASGIAFSLFGTIGSFHFFHYIGFACALSGSLPWSWMLLVWLIGSLSWMPVVGWVGIYYFKDYTLFVRIIIVACSTLLFLFTHFTRTPGTNENKI